MNVPLVELYVSSMSADRKVMRDCRWALDFLESKKVPVRVFDLSIQLHARERLATLVGIEATSCEVDGVCEPAGLVGLPAEGISVRLPLLVLDLKPSPRIVSALQMQDLEDHADLDGLLTQALRGIKRQ